MSPPEPIKEVYACLVFILTSRNQNWEFISKFLKKNILKALEEFDPISRATNISKKDVKFFTRYRDFNYTEESIKRMSLNGVIVVRMIEAFFYIVDCYNPNLLINSQPVEI